MLNAETPQQYSELKVKVDLMKLDIVFQQI